MWQGLGRWGFAVAALCVVWGAGQAAAGGYEYAEDELPVVAPEGPGLPKPGDDPLPEVDPDGPFRVIDQDGSRRTSACIGYPVTPLCAAETLEAGFVRDHAELRAIATGAAAGPPGDFEPDPARIFRIRYRVIAARVLAPEDIPRGQYEKADGWHPGDVGITLEFWSCAYGRCDPPGPKDNESYVVRRDGQRWRVVYWDNYVDFTN